MKSMNATWRICGVDEAGRGPLAGPVYAAAVILDPARAIRGLADSKMLSEKKRAALEIEIRESAFAFCVAQASVEEIDSLNILRASLLAMKRAVEGLQRSAPPNCEVVVDGLHVPQVEFPSRAVVDGDRLVAEISAASVLAKTARDREMCLLDERFPQYGFARHKGYGTRIHLAALMSAGPCEIHRQSFAPVREAGRRALPTSVLQS
ncbi:MAG: ribonuclease HII [Usitatibacteraceae bacterium]